mgnify:FL=1
MTVRGFFAVGVWHPKHEVNVGSVWRTAHLYGASMIFTVGRRYADRQSSDTTAARLSIPLIHFADVDDLVRHLPYGAPLVGIELDPRARPLGGYAHRPAACYLFGAEDHGLSPDVRDRCHDLVQIEAVAPWSMNVANAAAIVMHHRHTAHQLAMTRSTP